MSDIKLKSKLEKFENKAPLVVSPSSTPVGEIGSINPGS
jgi:hypothetical protein